MRRIQLVSKVLLCLLSSSLFLLEGQPSRTVIVPAA